MSHSGIIKKVNKVDCHECGTTVEVYEIPLFGATDCPECGTELPVPGLLGDYVLMKEMGAGAVGTVYQSFDQNLHRYVAIKLMHRHYGEDPAFVERFIREARALAALNHPNIVQIYTCGREQEQPYIVMELVDGGRMDEWTKSGVQSGETEVLLTGRAVAQGLEAANQIGLVHGDIKPENILFDQKGEVKVVDFGLARQANRDNMDQVWGTPNYIAPEKARKEMEDHRADIYSLGATLFYALAGQPAFEGETPQDVILARLQRPAPRLSDFRSDLNPKTVDIVARMLEMDPGRRYPTYASLQADIRRSLEPPADSTAKVKKKSSVRGPVRGPSARGRKPPPQKKSPARLVIYLIISFLAVMVAGGVVGYKLHTSSKARKAQVNKPKNPRYLLKVGPDGQTYREPITEEQERKWKEERDARKNPAPPPGSNE